MKPIIVGILSVIIVIISVGATFVVVNTYKNQEILDIKTLYGIDIDILEEQNDNLTNELNKYQDGEYIYGNGTIFSGAPMMSGYYYLTHENNTYFIRNLPEEYQEDSLKVNFVALAFTGLITIPERPNAEVEILEIEKLDSD